MNTLENHIFNLVTHITKGETKRDKKQNLLVILNVAHTLMNCSELSRIKYKMIAYTVVDKLESIKYDRDFVAMFKKSLRI